MTVKKSKTLKKVISYFERISTILQQQVVLLDQLLFDPETDNEVLYKEILSNEDELDRLEDKMNNNSIKSILFRPLATELRIVVAGMRISGLLERSGDIVVNLAKLMKDEKIIAEEYRADYKEMLSLTKEMLNDAFIAFSMTDAVLAQDIIKRDNKVDELNKGNFYKITHLKEEKKDSFTQKEMNLLLKYTSISYNIERIADKATDLAEATIYVVEGRDIRHKK